MLLKKKLFSITMSTLLVLSLAGCDGSKPQPSSLTPAPAAAAPENKDLILATTTSTQDSGLLDVLIPEFEKQTGYKVKTVAVGTGAAEAFKKTYDSKSLFISRGDNSGTHKMELSLWKTSGITPSKDTATYQESGQGMGQTLSIAQQKSAYTLTDRATYLAQKQNLKLDIMVEGEKSLLNIYHTMQVSPDKFPKVNSKGGKAFVDFMVAPSTQKLISEFGVSKYGQQLFFADAGKKQEDLGK